MNNTWKNKSERSNTFTLKLICWIALHTSRWVARLWLYPVTLYFLLTSSDERTASRNYLRRAGINPTNLNVAKHIFCFSTTILDRVFFLTDRFDKFDISVYQREIISESLSGGRGFILLGSHLGSFEVLRSLVIKRGEFPLKVLMNYDHNAMIMKVLDTLNPEVANTVINLKEDNVAFKIAETIDDGKMVAILGDRPDETGLAGVDCVLLGEHTEIPSSPVKLAMALQVPIIMFFGIYKGSNRYEIYFEKLLDADKVDRSNRQTVINNTLNKYTNILEKYIHMAPYNWFNFYDYWHDEK